MTHQKVEHEQTTRGAPTRSLASLQNLGLVVQIDKTFGNIMTKRCYLIAEWKRLTKKQKKNKSNSSSSTISTTEMFDLMERLKSDRFRDTTKNSPVKG